MTASVGNAILKKDVEVKRCLTAGHKGIKKSESEQIAMWKCPKCGREFKKKEQSHYCGEKPKTIEEYILRQDEERREDLRYIHAVLRRALPEAEERISWSMPTYWKNHNLVQFAASKNHIGFYPGSEAVAQFAGELQGYKTNKGTIQILYGRVDAALIEKIAKWCWEREQINCWRMTKYIREIR